MSTEKYPAWRRIWDERTQEVEDELGGLWQRTVGDVREADNVGEAAKAIWGAVKQTAGSLVDAVTDRDEPAGEREGLAHGAGEWWSAFREKAETWYQDESAETKAEIAKAWEDREYIGERIKEAVEKFRNRGDKPA